MNLSQLKSQIHLDNPLRVLYHQMRGMVANTYYKNPSKNMVVIGITGTKGKTTVCNLVCECLADQGKKVCMFSTATLFIG